MNQYNIGFVILHYQAWKETLECIESIKRNVGNMNYSIVIIDNHSPNNSGKIIEEKFKESQNIFFLQSDDNIGFANGNNLGYQFAKNELKCDFICCLNNDTQLIQKKFVHKIFSEYSRSGFAVLAPMVILKNGEIQHFNSILRNKKFYESELKKWKIASDLSIMQPVLTKKQRVLKQLGIIGKFLTFIKKSITMSEKKIKENVVLHGCCLIFSPKYVKMFDTAFDTRTFMFREEELLYLRLIKNSLKSVYNPKIKIKHLEDAATDQTYNDTDEKFEFYKKNQIVSLKILISELENI